MTLSSLVTIYHQAMPLGSAVLCGHQLSPEVRHCFVFMVLMLIVQQMLVEDTGRQGARTSEDAWKKLVRSLNHRERVLVNITTVAFTATTSYAAILGAGGTKTHSSASCPPTLPTMLPLPLSASPYSFIIFSLYCITKGPHSLFSP